VVAGLLRIALISDIHANLPALEAVLADMPEVDHIACLGDMVGYYPDCNEVCAAVRALDALVIRGNHDAYVTGALEPDPERRAAYRTDWTRETLEPTHFEWLRGLPPSAQLHFDDVILTLRHANPWDEERYLYPDSPLLDDIRLEARSVLAIGHTHRPMTRRVGEGLLVNPGSIGQPRDWIPLACYAVLELPSFDVGIRRVSYDVPAYQRKLIARGLPPSSIDILSRLKG
jgi:predicted phosphodiesterase